jgi:hypothetical protein
VSDTPESINEIDIERHMNDNASRVEMISFMQKRYSYMQKLMSKAQILSDKDFETAFTTFESVVDSLSQKKQKNSDLDKPDKNRLTNFITKST